MSKERPARTLIRLDLPLPPSINKAYTSFASNKAQVGMSAEYYFWYDLLKEEYEPLASSLPTLKGLRYGLWIEFSSEMKGDIDNRLKVLSDVLVYPRANSSRKTRRKREKLRLCTVQDDRFMDFMHVKRTQGLQVDRCTVVIVSSEHWREYVGLFT